MTALATTAFTIFVIAALVWAFMRPRPIAPHSSSRRRSRGATVLGTFEAFQCP